MDDIRWLLERIEKGMTWSKVTKSLVFDHDVFQSDEHKTDVKKTQEVLLMIMNDIHDDLSFTTESQEDFYDNKLPTLDFTMRLVDDNKYISYNFYKKAHVQ